MSSAAPQAPAAPQSSIWRYWAPFTQFGESHDPTVVEFICWGGLYALLKPVSEQSCLSGPEAAQVLEAINTSMQAWLAVTAQLASRADRPVLCFKIYNRPLDGKGRAADLNQLIRCQHAASVQALPSVEVTTDEFGFWRCGKTLPVTFPMQLKGRVDDAAYQRLQQAVDKEMRADGCCACASVPQRVGAVVDDWNASDGKQQGVQVSWRLPPSTVKLQEPKHDLESFWFTRLSALETS